jgi:RimJ/RimL family protein N-acetyltransferase
MASQAKSPFPAGFTIITPRLRIIPLDPENQDHCEFLVHLWNTDLFVKSLGLSGISDATSAKNFIRNRVLADYERNKHGLFLVLLYNEETKQTTPIGTASLMKGAPSTPHYLAPDVGYVILPEMNGRGYATEATKGLIEYAKNDLGIDDVFGFCSPKNIGSRRVLEKAGMEFRGVAELTVFGRLSAIYALPEMNKDLSVYGVNEEIQQEDVVVNN